jgi:hypothetical protein
MTTEKPRDPSFYGPLNPELGPITCKPGYQDGLALVSLGGNAGDLFLHDPAIARQLMAAGFAALRILDPDAAVIIRASNQGLYALDEILPDRSTAPPAHTFIRPGQVGPGRPAPDACVECGQPEVGHPAPEFCGAPGPDGLTCTCTRGHNSYHYTVTASGDTVEWSPNDPAAVPDVAQPAGLPAAAEQCDVDWGSAAVSQRCVRNAGHEGQHADLYGRWSPAAGSEQVEPACGVCRSSIGPLRRLEHEPGWVCENTGACGRRKQAAAKAGVSHG